MQPARLHWVAKRHGCWAQRHHGNASMSHGDASHVDVRHVDESHDMSHGDARPVDVRHVDVRHVDVQPGNRGYLGVIEGTVHLLALWEEATHTARLRGCCRCGRTHTHTHTHTLTCQPITSALGISASTTTALSNYATMAVSLMHCSTAKAGEQYLFYVIQILHLIAYTCIIQ